jgi:hypothetical protein
LEGGFTLGGDITTNSSVLLYSGVFDANNYNVTALNFSSNYTDTRSIYLGSGTITLTGTGTPWNLLTTTNLTFDAETSTIILNNASSSAKTFAGGGLTYNNVHFTGAGTGIFTISGANTFNTLTIDTAPKTVRFTNGTTQTVTSFVADGSSGNLITLNSNSTGNKWTISRSAGDNEVNFCSIKDSTATGGANWIATDSINEGNNTGWDFGGGGSGLWRLRGGL